MAHAQDYSVGTVACQGQTLYRRQIYKNALLSSTSTLFSFNQQPTNKATKHQATKQLAITSKPAHKHSLIHSSTMAFFKSSKNQSASAAVSPAATPRSSMHEQRSASTMTLDQAILMLHKKAMPNVSARPYVR
ncbi:hypothetical protein EDD21DRAFT_444139 [Dissophora ornata]|nr:hypothetical protein EDD21DRAFT_444139 [Dissophora ornata]